MSAPLRASVQPSGETVAIELPRSLASAYRAGESLRLIVHGADALLLLRESQQGYFAGDLSSVSIGELFGLVVSGVRSGKLVLTRGAARKTVRLVDGEIVFATSTEPYERLGRSMIRQKLLTPEQVEEALAQVKQGLRLGQVLTSSRLITPAALYSAMGGLVKEIVLSLFELEDGQWMFLEGLAPADDAVKLSERTQDVLLQGMRRAEEVSRLRKKFPPMRRLVQGQRPLPAGLEELAPLITLAERGTEVVSLRAEFEGGERAFLVALDQLVASGALAEEEAKKPAVEPQERATKEELLSSGLKAYSTLVRDICEQLLAAGRNLTDLGSFFTDPLPGLERPFQGIELGEDGSLDVLRIRSNVENEREACEAIDAFISYALFSAKNVIPPEQGERLATELRRIQKALG
ncbi:MAG: DUF4388 domain-containing protein [Myxococcales bacterium]|nr:DUF4388 domain-containing protein [Myxococcales bacterium]